MSGPVSIYISRCNNTRELLEKRTSEISPDCEKAIGLNQSDLKFRSGIAGSIGLALAMEHLRLAGDPEGDSPKGDTRETLPEPKTGQEIKERAKFMSRKERVYKAFDLLVKCLAGAYTQATGQRPTTSYSDSDALGHGAFWRLVEIVLPVACEVAVADGIEFPYPPGIEARAKKIARILTKRKKRSSL